MKKLKVLFLVLVFPLFGQVLVSCCECMDSSFLSYTNCSISTLNLDNSGISPQIASSNSIPKDAFGLRLVLLRSEDVCEHKHSNSIFIQSAYALSCDCPPKFEYQPLNIIKSLKINTQNDFDSIHPSGSDITELFFEFKENRFTSLDDFVENLDTVIPNFLDPIFEFDLLLMSSPTIGQDHEFQVSIELSDGRTLNAKTGILKLL